MIQRDVNPIFTTTTPIRFNNIEGGGTGFFLNYEKETYLITNRHVVDPEEHSPNEARIWFRNYENIIETNHYDLSLSDGEGEDWYSHPDQDVDLAIIPLNPRLSSLDEINNRNHKTGSLAFTFQHFIHDNVSVDNRVIILGYPGDFVDSSTLFPVKRNALISTPYGIPFDGDPYFVTDARMHSGTSGSPVLMDVGGMMRTLGEIPEKRQKSVYLLGVHSATFYKRSITGDQLWDDTDSDSEQYKPTKYELNVAWYPELIKDIIEKCN